MSETHRRRGSRPPSGGKPWTVEEDALVRTLPAADVVARTGRSVRAVYARRHRLEIQTDTSEPPVANPDSYAVRRLALDRPDLLEKVKAGELTAHKALIEAGFRKARTLAGG
jgi:hypothetical protein